MPSSATRVLTAFVAAGAVIASAVIGAAVESEGALTPSADPGEPIVCIPIPDSPNQVCAFWPI